MILKNVNAKNSLDKSLQNNVSLLYNFKGTTKMANETESCKYNLGTDGQFFLIVTYESFEDVTPGAGGGIITQVRTIDLMGTAPVNQDHLPDWLQNSITQACASHAAHKLYEIETV